MGLKLQLRVSWGLVNLYVCAIAVGLTIPGTSGSGSPVSVEASSVAPIEATAVTPEPGPLLNGPTLQPPIVSLPLDSPPPIPAETPQQQPHVSTPPPASEPPDETTPPLATKPPEAMTPMPIVDPPQALPLPPPPESKPALSPQPPGVALPPLTVPLPLNPPHPSPSSPTPVDPPPRPSDPIVPLIPPQASPTTSSAPPPLELPAMSPPPSSPPPLMMSPPATPSQTPPPSTIPSQTPPPLMMPPPVPPPSTIPAQTPPPLVLSPPSPPPPTIPGVAIPPYPSSPPPLMTSPPAPSPPSTVPSQTPPPLAMSPPVTPPPSTMPSQTPPPPLMMSPPAPPPSSIASHTPFAPPPLEEPASSVPPSPAMQEASPPRGSPKGEVHGRAPPPVLDSPEAPPSSSVAPLSAPPIRKATPESNPPTSHQMAPPAPKHSAPSVVKTNASEPHSPPSPAQVPTMAPPGKEPVELSPAAHPSPRHGAYHNRTPSEPKFGRHNETAPAPISLPKPPPRGGSHLSPRHSPVRGSPMVEVPPPSGSETPETSPTPSTIRRHSSGHSNITLLSPNFSPPGSPRRNATKSVGSSIQALPPPPPNQDCAYLTCPAPFTNTPTGSPCGCVWPMQVGLRLTMALYTFFPLASELAEEISAGVSMKPSQVRVMGAESGIQDPDKIIVLVDLVPFHERFDETTASLTFQRFWHKQVHLDKPIFGDYDVLYVHYPGLPPSPPLASADAAVVNSMPYSVVDNNGSTLHPLGVMLPNQRHKNRFNGILIAVIVFSAIVGVMTCFSVAWILILRRRNRDSQAALSVQAKNSLGRSSGPTGHSIGSGRSSFSAGSNLGKYPGTAKTFTTSEIEKATDSFNPSRVLGEGGFGCVYSGSLEDGTSVAVKVLKRDDKQGGREFLAEVEMLNRVHHRNLVKLIGICVDDSVRCLVYELVPNGSVESHLHGADKEAAPLDWSSRLKIALGAARGLAYLHEDSSPGVIHRDFKSSNILLEDDFTPKVSDFGLARAALSEENRHISTQIMGTFGYVAPEYAMTGHLLAKSDVYSYGVVLLELLTGRRPIDMLQPAGEENLVAWARPHLTSREGLVSIIDPCLLSSDDVSLESVAKVAAIASMCVQPEVSHRPFMGEVVQALKLVSNEENASKEDDNSPNCSPKNMSLEDFEAKLAMLLDDVEKGEGSLPRKGIFSMSGGFRKKKSSSIRRISSSGPMRSAKGGSKLWEGIRKWSPGSRSEHGTMYRLWPGSH